MAGLHTELVGTGRPRLAFLHGLFGRGRNWSGVASALAADGHPGVLFDLPNHGSSPWTDEFGYRAMADSVADELRLRLGSAARLTVVGHSLGGKVAMLVALAHPELVESLAVVDIAPAPSEGVDGFGPLVAALQSVDLTRVSTRAEVETQLAGSIPDAGTRQLLMQNLRARPQWHWQPNLDLLGASLDAIADWPDPGPVSYPGPVLWLRGERSEYVRPEHLDTMRRLFPAVELRTVAGAGHWVHADNPAAVVAELQRLVGGA
ncbi:MAG: alpha/beta fold hydrolase [Propionicimonas sp.]|nr:alpha/beta fold hydrolase [Propionicimonas sp.]